MNSSYATQRRLAAIKSPSPFKSDSALASDKDLLPVIKLDHEANIDSKKESSSFVESTTSSRKQEIQVLSQECDTAVIQNVRLEHDLEETQAELAACRDEFDLEQEEHEKQLAILIYEYNRQGNDERARSPSEDSLLGPVNHELVETPDQVGDYHLSKLLGTGKFARVRLGIHRVTQDEYAIKCIDKSSIRSPQHMHQLVNELTVLLQISHVNIVKAHATFHAPNIVYVVMELASTDLFEYSRRSNNKEKIPLREIMIGILQPLEFLHSIGICHCDIKVENILLVKHNEELTRRHVRLCDFGLCCVSTSTDAHAPVLDSGFKGTIPLVAPEVILSKQDYDARPVDMWAVGCTLLELTDGYPDGWDDAYKLCRSDKVGFQEGMKACLVELRGRQYSVNDDAFDIVCGLLRMTPEHRRTASRVLEHPWFDGCFAESSDEEEEG